MKKLILWVCIFLLLVSFVFAEPPFQTAEGVNTLEVRIPHAEFLKLNRGVQSNIHVFNKTTGLELPNTLVDCDIHIYNSTGYEVLGADYLNEGGFDKQLNISGTVFSKTGRYGFEIDCNATPKTQTNGQGGFANGGFEVTESGTDETPIDNTSGIAIVIFILAITGSLFAFSMKKDILKNEFANIIARRSLLVLGIYLMILNSAIMATLAATSNLPLTREMFVYLNLFGYVGYPAMLLLMLSALFQALSDMKQKKKRERTGDEDGE